MELKLPPKPYRDLWGFAQGGSPSEYQDFIRRTQLTNDAADEIAINASNIFYTI